MERMEVGRGIKIARTILEIHSTRQPEERAEPVTLAAPSVINPCLTGLYLVADKLGTAVRTVVTCSGKQAII